MSPGSTATTTLRLNTGRDMPLVGLGTWQAPRGVVGAAVADALRAGYTHVDLSLIHI